MKDSDYKKPAELLFKFIAKEGLTAEFLEHYVECASCRLSAWDGPFFCSIGAELQGSMPQ